ncbi:MAG TPA: hypothetical protein VE593_04415 [Nitrososphaeraceae archaeon]|nr:hypothetical protein [Nitrososphaeraceae archaeon]
MTAKKSVFSLMALLILSTLIAGATFFQTTVAQPMMSDSSIGMGNSGSSGMDFNPMSFANNLSNASSLYGSVGISMVNRVKVTSINLLENNEISVTLRHFPAAADTSNSLSATTMSAAVPPRVTVTAIRVPMNLKDLMSLASSESSKMMTGNMSNTMMMGGGPLQGFGGAAGNGTNNFNPLSFLTDLQIGSSSTVANADWSSPQIVRMGLTGMMGRTNNNSSAASTADFIIVSVIPYTGRPTPNIPAG